MVNRYVSRTPIEIGNDVWFFDVSGDPSVGGQTAGVGSLARVIDGDTPGAVYRKTGTDDTDWTLVSQSPLVPGGASTDYPKTTDGASNLLAASDAERAVLIQVEVTETFADGDNAQSAFTCGLDDGDTPDPDAFFAAAALEDEAAGTKLAFAGIIPAGSALTITGTPAAGTGTGAIRVTAHALPTGS